MSRASRRAVPKWMRRPHLRRDLTAGLVLGVESVPDGLASGVLAGVNPLAALYAYLYGMVGAAFFTSTTLMSVQATGAMALVVSDTDLSSRSDPEGALYTLAMLTGLIMIVAGLLKGGSLLRFVPTAVMTGFVTAVGVNIVLGQLGDFTGATLTGANRILKTLDLVTHPRNIDPVTITVGIVTLLLIVVLQRTRLGALGLVAAMAIGSALAAGLSRWFDSPVALVGDIAEIPNTLPLPTLPTLGDLGFLLLPAVSLAFIGLVQGAAVSAGVPNPDGHVSDYSRDFVGQGVGNVVAGVFRGMPVGGSMSASALLGASGARSRLALGFASGVMALVILLFAGVVGLLAMPAIAALLIVVGAGAIKPAKVRSVVKTGTVQTTILVLTFVLTLLIPVQYAVLVGVALAILLHVAQQSNRVRLVRLEIEAEGRMREVEAPTEVPGRRVLVLQPYGSLFFASAPMFRSLLPEVTSASQQAVVILRLRGVDQLGLTLIEVLRRYATDLQAHDGTLKLVLSDHQVAHQVRGEGLVDLIGEENLYLGNEWLGATVHQAYDDGVVLLAQGDDAP